MRIDEMVDEMKDLEGKYAAMISEIIAVQAQNHIVSALTNEAGLSFSWIELEDQDVDFVKDMVERVRNSVDIVVAVNKKESSLVFVAGSSENAIKAGFKAGDLAKLAAVTTGGNGGGRPNFAQAGGKDLSKLSDARGEIYNKVGIIL